MVSTVTLLTALLLAPGMTLQAANAPAGMPNVLLIITDDQGYGDVGRHGNPVLKTSRHGVVPAWGGMGRHGAALGQLLGHGVNS